MSHDDLTPLSALSLQDLHRDLVQRAATAAARARTHHREGRHHTARELERKAAHLMAVARSMKVR